MHLSLCISFSSVFALEHADSVDSVEVKHHHHCHVSLGGNQSSKMLTHIHAHARTHINKYERTDTHAQVHTVCAGIIHPCVIQDRKYVVWAIKLALNIDETGASFTRYTPVNISQTGFIFGSQFQYRHIPRSLTAKKSY